MVVKVAGIPWFSRLEEGVKQAAKDFGVNAYMVGPTTADPAPQVQMVEDGYPGSRCDMCGSQ